MNDSTEFLRRKKSTDGHEIIDKPTYNKLIKKFVSLGGVIIGGESAAEHLKFSGAYASYISGANAAFISDEATVSDVLEEMYHAEQDRKNLFGTQITKEVLLHREIDAQKYLLRVAEKYKIPAEETAITKQNLIYYEGQLKNFLAEGANKND